MKLDRNEVFYSELLSFTTGASELDRAMLEPEIKHSITSIPAGGDQE